MQTPQRKKVKKESKIKASVKILWTIVAAGFALFIVVLASAYFGVFGKLPSLEELENPQANLATEI
jgi:penicillin-binding protein 1A